MAEQIMGGMQMNSRYVVLVLFCLIGISCGTYERSFGVTHTKAQPPLKNIRRLNLSYQDSTITNLIDLGNLRMLDLSGNRTWDIHLLLKSIPCPDQLEVLILDDLELTHLPISITRFTQLRHLSLNNNPALDLEESLELIQELPLRFLNLQENNLVGLPSNISKLEKLDGINLSKNHIVKNSTFTHLSKLPKLRSLWLTKNALTRLPKNIGFLNQLNFLYIEHNQLKELPTSVEQLKKVTVLHMGYNDFEVLPEEIRHMPRLMLLHANNCKIHTIPDSFEDKKYSLKSILMDDNALSNSDKEKWRRIFRTYFMASFE